MTSGRGRAVGRLKWTGRVGRAPTPIAAGLLLVGLVALASCSPETSSTPPRGPDVFDRAQKAMKPYGPADRKGFDECGLLRSADWEKILRQKDVAVTSRQARPVADGWRTSCGYDNGRVGLSVNVVTVETDVDPEKFEPFSRPFESKPEPVEGLGDKAWVYQGPGFGESREIRIQVLVGDKAVLLGYFAPAPGGTTKAGIDLARKAIRRLPDKVDVVPDQPFGACGRIDRDLMGKILGEEPRTARSTGSGFGDISCDFAGESASVAVSVWNRLETASYMKKRGPKVSGIGDEATFRAKEGGFDATIRVGKKIVDVRGTYTGERSRDRTAAAAREKVERALPDKDERAFLGGLTRTFGGR